MDGTRLTFVSFRTDPNQEKQERLLNSNGTNFWLTFQSQMKLRVILTSKTSRIEPDASVLPR